MTALLPILMSLWLAVALHLWQTTLILLPIFLLARGMRSAPAGLLHVLWSLALAKLLLPAALLEDLGRPLAAWLPERAAGALDGVTPYTLDAVRGVLDPTRVIGHRWVAPSGPLAWIVLLLTGLWLFGMLRMWVRLGRDLAGMRHEAGRPVVHLAPALRGRLERALAGTDLPRDRVRIVGAAVLPCVTGLLRPRVLIPRALVSALSVAELRAVLIHENAHRRRLEPLRRLVQRAGAGVLFFYPPLWLVLRRLEHTAELVCDAAVARAGVTGRTYARALARSVAMGLRPAVLATAIGVGGGPVLGVRLDRFSNSGRYRTMPQHRLALAVAVTLVLAGSLLPAPQIRADVDDTPAAPGTAGEAAPPSGDAEEAPAFDTPPQPVKTVPPEYPEQARKARIEGRVTVRVLVDEAGVVAEAEIDQGVDECPEMGEACLVAARQWLFKPAKLNDEPVPCEIIIPFQFRLDGTKK